MFLISKLANIQMISWPASSSTTHKLSYIFTWYLHIHILEHFRIYYINIHYLLKRFIDVMKGCKRKKLQKADKGRLKRSTACQRTNTKEVVFSSPRQIEAVERDRATIWPQLRAMHCKSNKINGNNSTLDAHHYPDGVLGDLHRPPNQDTDTAQTESVMLKYHHPPRWFSIVCLCW